MKSLFAKSVVFFVVLTTSRCAPGRLGTIDRYNPSFSLTDDVDDEYVIEVHTIGTTESDGTAEDSTWEYYEDDATDETTDEIPSETPVPHIDLLDGQDDTTKGQYVCTNKTGCSDPVVDVAGPL